MHQNLLFLTCLTIALASCSKSEKASESPKQVEATKVSPAPNAELNAGQVDVCAMLSSDEIRSIQGEPFTDVKGSAKSEAGLAVSQCYYALPTHANSVVVSVTKKGGGPEARDPKEFWAETFHREKEAERGGESEEEKEKSPPLEVEGVGQEAFWTGNALGGALYVLSGDAFIRVGVGGAGDQAAKVGKSKAIAEIVLRHLGSP